MTNMRYSKYVLPDGTAVYLTQRPDRATPESVAGFLKEVKPVVRFQFTDDMIYYPFINYKDEEAEKLMPPAHWYPWVPGKQIPVECVFAYICLMSTYVNRGQGSIWLHCDSSTMRAPTYFGLYLHATYDDETIKSICEGMTVSDNFDIGYAQYSRADRYLEISLRKDLAAKELVDAWRAGGMQAAYEQYMKVPKGSED